MKHALACLLLLAACGPKPGGSGSTTENHKQPPLMVAGPCPAGADLNALALTAWGKTGGTATAECLALRVKGEILWLVDGWWEPPPETEDYSVGSWSALVTPAGEVRWADGDDDMPAGVMLKDSPGRREAVDLDGDETDEVLQEVGYNTGGYYDSSLVVARVIDGKLEYAGGDEIKLSSDNSAADPEDGETYSCMAEWAVVEGAPPRQVAITYDGDCERSGRFVYQWNGQALAEVTAAH
jgi:hypothetical protein